MAIQFTKSDPVLFTKSDPVRFTSSTAYFPSNGDLSSGADLGQEAIDDLAARMGLPTEDLVDESSPTYAEAEAERIRDLAEEALRAERYELSLAYILSLINNNNAFKVAEIIAGIISGDPDYLDYVDSWLLVTQPEPDPALVRALMLRFQVNEATARSYITAPPDLASEACQEGYVWDPDAQACRRSTDCPEGSSWSPAFGQCITLHPCPEGSSWSPTFEQCITLNTPLPPTCATGYVWDLARSQCVRKPKAAEASSGLALAVVGAVGGFFVGGPIGAAAGGVVGLLVGGQK